MIITRRAAAALLAIASVVLLWVPYFDSLRGSVRLVDSGSFVSLWLGRAALALLLVAAALVVRRPRWAAAAAAAAALLTVAAGEVPAWRGSACAGWAFYTPTSDACATASEYRTPNWGWGVAVLLAVVAATVPLWGRTPRRSTRPMVVAAALLAVVGVAVASLGPVFRAPGPLTIGYVDYVPSGVPPTSTGWHGWFAPIGLVLLVLAAAAATADLRVASVLAIAACTALAVAGAVWPGRLGWAYWTTLGCAAGVTGVLVVRAVPRPSPDSGQFGPTVVSPT